MPYLPRRSTSGLPQMGHGSYQHFGPFAELAVLPDVGAVLHRDSAAGNKGPNRPVAPRAALPTLRARLAGRLRLALRRVALMYLHSGSRSIR